MIHTDARIDALGRLRAVVDKAKRKEMVPFPKSFLRAYGDQVTPPLARLVQGGRGGEVRLKLYLTITLMATRRPHDIQRPPAPQAWARLFALPGETATRRVSSNLKWLHTNKFIALVPRAGSPSLIVLLDPAGSGNPYTRPMEQGAPYISMPLELWSQGWILDLSPTALAMLMVLLDVQQEGRGQAQYVSRYQRESYGLSPDTWTRACKELKSHELLHIMRVPQGSDFDYQRMRNLYHIDKQRLTTPPAPISTIID